MEILEKILGNKGRVRLMKLFLLNRSKGFKSAEVASRSRVSPDIVRRELNLLASVNFIKKREQDWFFNSLFKYAAQFEELLVRSDIMNTQTVLDNFKNIGRVKLLIISGVFIKS